MTNDQCSPLPYSPYREFLTPENLNRLNVNTDVEALLLSWMINSPEGSKSLILSCITCKRPISPMMTLLRSSRTSCLS